MLCQHRKPTLLENNKELVWRLIASLYVANVLLVVLNLPLVGLCVQLLRIPKGLLTAIILVFSTVGAYSLQGSLGDVVIVWLLGIAAFLLRRYGFPIAPVLLGLVLGPLIEQDLRRSLAMSSGDFSIFLSRPLAASILALIAAIGLYKIVSLIRRPWEMAAG